MTDARAIHAKADEAARTLADEFKPSELLGVDAKGHMMQTTVAAHVIGGKFVPLVPQTERISGPAVTSHG